MMKNYKEAAKCFEQALKYNPDNLQIHRDTANLYLHSRDYISYKETSRRFLVRKPELLSSWCNYALSCNLSLDYEQAIDNINSLLEISAGDKNVDNVSRYNILLYKAELLKKTEQYDELIAFLLNSKTAFLNKIEYATYLYQAYLVKNDHEQALKYLKYLVVLLPDNKEFLIEYAKLSADTIVAGLKSLKSQLKSSIIDALILEVYSDEEIDHFKIDFKKLLILNADRFNPNFIQDTRCFANTNNKCEVINQEYISNIKSLKDNKTLSNGVQVTDPTYMLFMLSQYATFLYWRKYYTIALLYIDEAIEHTSTFQDLYVLRAKILEKVGRMGEAMEVADFYQSLDTADRCLSKAAVKILLRGGDIVRADNLFKRFMQQNNSTEKNIHDLQKITYELRVADSYIKNLNFARGLRLYKMIIEHIDEFNEDQHDFYTYCLRKFLIKNLLDVIRFNDVSIKNSKIFIKANVKYIKNLNVFSRFKRNGYSGNPNNTNVIEVNDDTDKSLDVTGKRFMEKLNIEEEIRNTIKRLNTVNITEIKPKLLKKLNTTLFEYYINTDKLIPCIKVYSYLLENDISSFDNKIRKILIDEKLQSIDYSKLSEIENIIVEDFKNNHSTQYSQYIMKYEQGNKLAKYKIMPAILDIIFKGINDKDTDLLIAEEINDHINKTIEDIQNTIEYKVS